MKKLNLGCGFDYREDWVNLDLYNHADVVHDMNNFPYPFEDDYFDIVLCFNMLEHFIEPKKVLEEINRITKKGGLIQIKIPFYNSYDASTDITHIKYFTYDSLDYLYKDSTVHSQFKWELIEKIITTNYFIPLFIARPLSLIFGNLVNNIEWRFRK